MLLRSLVLLTAVMLLAPGCTKSPPATPSAAASTPAPTPAPAAPEAVGGYAPVSIGDPEVVAAADKALELLRTRESDPTMSLKAVTNALKQIVAGTNYSLQLDLTTAKGPKSVQVVLYQPLGDGAPELTRVAGL